MAEINENYGLIGVNGLITEIRETILFMLSDDYKNTPYKHSKGIILVGHPGCGKTQLAANIIKEFVDKCPNVLSIEADKGVLGSDRVSKVTNRVNMFFEPVKANQDRFWLIYSDEIDGIIVSPDNRSVLSTELTTAWNKNIQGKHEIKNMFVIGTTNHPNRMDAASVRDGRLELMYVRDPNYESRIELIKYYISKLDICDWNDDKIIAVAKQTRGLNGSSFNSIGEKLYKKWSRFRRSDIHYQLTSRHVNEEVTKAYTRHIRIQNGYKQYWLEDCEALS